MNIRVRFAPSPTGYLHVGGARTALFNWLYARHEGGKFLLRIEDTDKARSADEHTQVILDGLSWLGLDWDEKLVFQGARVKRHQEIADRLLAEGKAYMEEGAIRFRVPPGEIAWEDAVHGRISFQGADIKDFIILRSDRTPIYNLAVVVDDLDMGITHVLRGDDHISNTPKQIALYQALDAPLPVFGHVPMINGPDGKKLSKRHGVTAVGDYQHMGILPAAMRNFLALLGWSPGGDREIMTLDEMIQLFSFAGIQQKALQAPRRPGRGRLPPLGHPPRRDAQLPGPARLESRGRSRDHDAGRDDPAVFLRRDSTKSRDLRHDEDRGFLLNPGEGKQLD